MALFGAPLDEDGVPDFAAAVQLSTGFVDGYDSYGEEERRPRLSPDGKWVAWLEVGDGELYVRPVDGSVAARQVSGDAFDFDGPGLFDWAPNSAAIAFLEFDSVKVAFVDGRENRRCGLSIIGGRPLVDSPWAWSADGAVVRLELWDQDDDGDFVAHQWMCGGPSATTGGPAAPPA